MLMESFFFPYKGPMSSLNLLALLFHSLLMTYRKFYKLIIKVELKIFAYGTDPYFYRCL